MQFQDFLAVCRTNDYIMARNPELGFVRKKQNGDIVWVDTGKIVGLTNDVRKADWTIMQTQPQQEVLRDMYKKDIIATVYLPDSIYPIYYKVDKEGEISKENCKPVFMRSENKIHWVREETIPVQEIVHGLWYSEAI